MSYIALKLADDVAQGLRHESFLLVQSNSISGLQEGLEKTIQDAIRDWLRSREDNRKLDCN